MREPFRSWIYRWIPLGLCFFFALFSLGALLLALGNLSSSKSLLLGSYAGLGRILIDSFHFASFFIPLYFAACAYILVHTPFRLDWLGFLNVLLIPFFTLALALRLLFSPSVTHSPLPALFQRSFTSLGGGLISLLLFFVELSFLPQIYKWIHYKYGQKTFKPSEPLQIAPPSSSASYPETPSQSENTPQSSLLLENRQENAGNNSLQEAATAEELEEEAAEEVEEEASEEIEGDLLVEEQGEVEKEEKIDAVHLTSLEDKKLEEPYSIPLEGILHKRNSLAYWEIDDETRRAADVLRTTLEEFKIQAEVVGIRKGPVITMFEILPAPGVKLSRIVNLADNIALRLAAASVRIVAPIPGKHAVGIEVPNKRRAIVTFAEMVSEEGFLNSKMEIPMVLGDEEYHCIISVLQF